MSRENLFKAKRANNGEWVEGVPMYIEYDEKHMMLIENQENLLSPLCTSFHESIARVLAIEITPDTICRYTGLADNTKWEQLSENEKDEFLSRWNNEKNRNNIKEDWNGKKIFEGDILSAHLDNSCPDDITCVQVVWNGFSWCIRERVEDHVMTVEDCNIFEVCGNVFDNPELLEENE